MTILYGAALDREILGKNDVCLQMYNKKRLLKSRPYWKDNWIILEKNHCTIPPSSLTSSSLISENSSKDMGAIKTKKKLNIKMLQIIPFYVWILVVYVIGALIFCFFVVYCMLI